MYPDSFELASTVTVFGATVMMPLTMISGWLTWKKQYGGAKIELFKRKIAISFSMLTLSLIISVWRIINFQAFLVESWDVNHWLFLIAVILLIIGASSEGYYGGKLSHR